MEHKPLLEVRELSATLKAKDGDVHIINGVSFEVMPEETFGIIGESGCGKTMTSMLIMKYAARLGLNVDHGEILFNGENILNFNKKRTLSYNGGEVAIILQDPMQALDPLYKIKSQMIEIIRRHRKVSRREAIRQMYEITSQLSIPREKLDCYPHQLSGGMLQRIVGAMVVSTRPRLIIADEPTTALDVTIQIQYMKLLKEIQRIYHTAIIFISHDIHVISMICDRIAVMYAGQIVEMGTKEEIMAEPGHPYTKALFNVASLGRIPDELYDTIEGTPPDLRNLPSGCRFADRCIHCTANCQNKMPEFKISGTDHKVCCWRQ
ncbi:ABC transporter ATP-binding protein [Butyrivibrio sp. AE3004]|uniref:ABC transporter ATP-binding protein n=1 Tax=Butyrivibrio sp. AE3004 TaxID=1506994 RepID=UPI0004940384|nr:ABC transporter ATP-binding protein [Butyrivibrio sp. AE3004]